MNREQLAYNKGYRVTKCGNLIGMRGTVIGNLDPKGYYKTEFRINGKDIRFYTHRLQAYQKYGKKIYEKGIIVRHLNSNSLDNSWKNIAIGTLRDNYFDMPKEQRDYLALNVIHMHKARIKYSKDFVMKLREEYKIEGGYGRLGKKYNIPRNTVRNLIKIRKVF